MLPLETRELIEMHRYMRPAYSHTEAEFNARYLDGLRGLYADKLGNRIGVIGDNPVVLWSSHTDTVHKRAGKQRLVFGDGLLTTHGDETGGCLGADCTVGVWIMRQMFLARVPGLYIWHASEESGGMGSNHIAEHCADMLQGVQCAIAFDRRGTNSVVTHQWSGRTASDAFAMSLAEQLGPDYKPDPNGTFTDTANYAELIPECTNIGVGYYDQHTQRECLNVNHAVWLLGRMKALDVSALRIVRDPEPATGWNWRDYDDLGTGQSFRADASRDKVTALANLIWERPEEVASLLLSWGFDRDEIERDLVEHLGPDDDEEEDRMPPAVSVG